jgi:hypothetical protein
VGAVLRREVQGVGCRQAGRAMALRCTLHEMRDADIRSKLDRLRLTASRPEEVEQAERMIALFEAAADATPAEVVTFLGELGVYIDEDAHRRPKQEQTEGVASTGR